MALDPGPQVAQHRILERVADLVDRGTVVTTAARCLTPINVEQLRRAHQIVESGHTLAKVVLHGWPRSADPVPDPRRADAGARTWQDDRQTDRRGPC
ncbi:MAG: zinc-binding dehydrogenase, partial [Acidipropionibacterium jensenii]|nr:zinc-binding dehydrogenase [Acidipropionibacterium jensenii]